MHILKVDETKFREKHVTLLPVALSPRAERGEGRLRGNVLGDDNMSSPVTDVDVVEHTPRCLRGERTRRARYCPPYVPGGECGASAR